MPQLLELPFEILERILEKVVSFAMNEDGLLFIGRLQSKRSVELATVLSMRLVHSRVRLAADPLIFRDFSFSFESIKYLKRQPKALRLLHLSRYGKFAKEIEALMAPVEAASAEPYTDNDQRALKAFDKLLGTAYPRLNKLEVFGDFASPATKVRPWEEIKALPLPALVDLTIVDIFLALYLPHIAQNAPLLRRVTLGSESDIEHGAFDDHWSKQSSELQTACAAIPILDSLHIDCFDHSWVQSYLKHLALRSKRVTIATIIGRWAGTASEHEAALESLSGCDQLAEMSIENVDFDSNSSPEELELYTEVHQAQREAVFDYFIQRSKGRKARIGMHVVCADWLDLVEEDDDAVSLSDVLVWHEQQS